MYSYIAAFGKPILIEGQFSSIDFADITFNTIFWIDMCLRFLITFDDINKKKICTVKEIAMNYIKNDLVFDFLTILPLMRILKPEIIYIERVLG
tara:strand:- start:2244 stop:2525 length:282 start_codon:yes stop_codon:yes gene_type:complete